MSIILRTRRLTLRATCFSDAERISFLLNHFAVAGNLSTVPYPYFCADAQAWLQKRPKNPLPEETEFAVDLGDHGMIGAIGWRMEDNRPVIGYYLGLPYWGRGLMTEAAQAAINWFFAQTRQDAIVSGYFAFNRASSRIQSKLGFTETGRSLRHCLARNEQVSHIDTILTRAAWTESQEGKQAS